MSKEEIWRILLTPSPPEAWERSGYLLYFMITENPLTFKEWKKREKLSKIKFD